MPGPIVAVVLSTGRCGAQWLTAGLRDLCPGVDAEHEPIGPLYAPRRYFRRYDDPVAILEEPEAGATSTRSTRPGARTSRPAGPCSRQSRCWRSASLTACASFT